MKFAGLLSLIVLPSALAVTVGYDAIYDNPDGSMSSVACSDGNNGLMSRFPTFGDVPIFPALGSSYHVEGWNSASCGSCWKLSFEGASITVVAIDHAAEGFVLSVDALDALTNGQARELGRIEATETLLSPEFCHMV